jgi:hypothetical protein
VFFILYFLYFLLFIIIYYYLLLFIIIYYYLFYEILGAEVIHLRQVLAGPRTSTRPLRVRLAPRIIMLEVCLSMADTLIRVSYCETSPTKKKQITNKK